MSSAASGNEAEAGQPKHKVLVVEDEAHIRGLLASILSQSGKFTVTECNSGTTAQEELAANGAEYATCILDIMLGDANGEDILLWIKGRYPAMAVIMITGIHDEDLVVRCLSHGAIEFLQKPFELEDVPAIVASAIERQASIAEESGDISANRPASGWVELTAPSEIEYLSRMQRFTELLLATKFSPSDREDLRMIIEEAGRNAIEWGNKFDRNKRFHISYCIFNDRIVLKFEDEGEGFKPESIPNPTVDPCAHLARRKEQGKRPGGFGMYLVQNIMDEVIYNDRGNAVVMAKYFEKRKKKQE